MPNKHALIFVHGMGTYAAGWHEPAVTVLRSVFDDYPTLAANFKFDDVFKPVAVLYDDRFEQLRAQWKKDFGAFTAAFLGGLDEADSAERDQVGKKLSDVGKLIGAGEDDFIVTHALDVLLYRFFSTVRMAVNVSVAKQLLAVAKDTATFSSWNVIAHSLGTGVFHNGLHAIYETPLGDGQPPLKTTETRPRVIAMIANVSRVLQLPTLKAFESRVRPGSALSDRACAFYLNVRHRLDPFTLPSPFEPDFDWVGEAIFNSPQYQHIRPSHISLDNVAAVHDLEHYLVNPRVHVPIFRAILGSALIPEAEFTAAKTRFDSEIDAAIQAKVRDKLEPHLPAPGEDWQAVLGLILKGLSNNGH